MTKLKSLKKNLIERIPKGHLFLILILSSLFLTSALVAYRILDNNPPQARSGSSLGLNKISESARISAFVGEFRFSLKGYTSPGARVILEGLGIYDETYANKFGEFVFANRFSPLSPREACLTAFDTDGRLSSPVCLPPFSVKKDVSIGPILLPPTMSINDNQLEIGDYGILTGKAAPDSMVDIDLYADNYAGKISLTAHTDETGSYSLTLPTEHENTLRVFSINSFKELISDKSNTLTLAILPFWKLLLSNLILILQFLKDFALPIILLLEGLVLLWLFLVGHRNTTHPLALRPKNTLAMIKDRLPARKPAQELVKQAR